MLYDRSNAQTAQVSGRNAVQFEQGRLRRILVYDGLNTIIGMGGVRCDLVRFELIWHQDSAATVENKSQNLQQFIWSESGISTRSASPEFLYVERL
jgi:hypothetical protein